MKSIDYAPVPAPILLVDDDPAWLRSMRLTLRRAKLEPVITCADSRDVLPLLELHPIGLLLLDHGMPHLNGEDLLLQMKERFPQIPVILLSALPHAETACRCLKMGALAFLSKASTPAELVEGIHDALFFR